MPEPEKIISLQDIKGVENVDALIEVLRGQNFRGGEGFIDDIGRVRRALEGYAIDMSDPEDQFLRTRQHIDRILGVAQEDGEIKKVVEKAADLLFAEEKEKLEKYKKKS